MSGYQLSIEDYSKQNSGKIYKKIIFYTALIFIIFLSVYFIIILDTDWHRIGSGKAIIEQLSYFIGLDYRYNKSHRLYERILNESIKSAISNKKSNLILGRTAAEFKSNVGAQPIHSEIFVYLKSPILRRLLRSILENIQPSNWIQRNPFKEII